MNLQAMEVFFLQLLQIIKLLFLSQDLKMFTMSMNLTEG
jgi:hypothetical protein